MLLLQNLVHGGLLLNVHKGGDAHLLAAIVPLDAFEGHQNEVFDRNHGLRVFGVGREQHADDVRQLHDERSPRALCQRDEGLGLVDKAEGVDVPRILQRHNKLIVHSLEEPVLY